MQVKLYYQPKIGNDKNALVKPNLETYHSFDF